MDGQITRQLKHVFRKGMGLEIYLEEGERHTLGRKTRGERWHVLRRKTKEVRQQISKKKFLGISRKEIKMN